MAPVRRGLPGGALRHARVRAVAAAAGALPARPGPARPARPARDRTGGAGRELAGRPRRARGDAGPAAAGHGAGAGRSGAAERRLVGRGRGVRQRGGAPVHGRRAGRRRRPDRSLLGGRRRAGSRARWTPTCGAWCTTCSCAPTSTPRRAATRPRSWSWSRTPATTPTRCRRPPCSSSATTTSPTSSASPNASATRSPAPVSSTSPTPPTCPAWSAQQEFDRIVLGFLAEQL